MKKGVLLFLKISVFFSVFGCLTLLFVYVIFPKIHAVSFLSRFKVLESARENITVINTTKEVTVRENTLYADAVEKSKSFLVRIFGELPDQKTISQESRNFSSAIGVMMTNDGLITCDPNIFLGESARYSVRLSEEKTVEAHFLGVDTFLGLAFLKVDVSDFPVASFSDKTLRLGDTMAVLSKPEFSNVASVYFSTVSEDAKYFSISPTAFASTEFHEGVLLLSGVAPAVFGWGVAVDEEGKLLGFMGSKTIDGSQYRYIISIDKIREVVGRVSSEEFFKKNTRVFGAYYHSLNSEYSRQFNLKRERGAWIMFPGAKQGTVILSGSTAEKIGLRIGDIVERVNGVAIDAEHPFSNLLQSISDEESIRLEVFRKDETVTLELKK